MTTPKLTKHDTGICNYTGAFGVLITLTCIIQLFAYGVNHWLNNVLLTAYAYILFSYFFLAFQRHSSPIILIISCLFSLGIVIVYWEFYIISYIVIIQYVYCVTITGYLFIDGLYGRLVQYEIEKRAEEAVWADKI